MKVTYHSGRSLRSMLEASGVPKKDLAKAEKEIVKLNGLDSARGIADGTVLNFPSKLVIGDETIKLRKLTGDVDSRASADRPKPSGGKPMGAMGIYAFDDLRRGGRVDACGYSRTPFAGCSVSGCGASTTRRRTSYSGCGSSGCGVTTPRRRTSSTGCSFSACGTTWSTRRLATSGCNWTPPRRTSYSGCGSSGCGVSTPRRPRLVTGCG